MTARVLIVKNTQYEGPGLLRDVLQVNHVSADVVELERGDRIPPLDDYGAFIVLGGPASANDQTDEVAHVSQRVKEAVDLSVPFLGICLGMQILVRVSGGKVVPAIPQEVGFRNESGEQYMLNVTPAGQRDPLLDGLPERFEVFQLHGETVELTPEMDLLASGQDSSGKGCANQIIRVGRRAYGLQMHVELVPEMLAVWAVRNEMMHHLDRAGLQEDLSAIFNEYSRNGKQLFNNFLAIAGLSSAVELSEMGAIKR